jgi:hypothetical protein
MARGAARRMSAIGATTVPAGTLSFVIHAPMRRSAQDTSKNVKNKNDISMPLSELAQERRITTLLFCGEQR